MTPLVSILIPAFNVERWIGDTIRSALAQTWPRKEIIIVDDGSLDHTVDVARRFSSKEVKVVTKENQGAAATRNHALSLSHGDYIQWLDADDLLSPDKIAKQIEAAGKSGSNRTLFSSEWGYFAYRTDRASFNPTSLWHDLSPLEWLLRKLGENLHMQTATWLVSRELTQDAGPWDTRLLSDDDGEYFCRVLLASEGIRFVPEARVYYRVSPSGRLSRIGTSDRKKDAMLLAMKLHVKYILSLEESARVRKAWCTIPAKLADLLLSRKTGYRRGVKQVGRNARRQAGGAPVALEVCLAQATHWLERGKASTDRASGAQGIPDGI